MFLYRSSFIFFVMFFLPIFSNAQTKDISFYIELAERNSPSIKQNESLRRINLLQNELIIAQNLKPLLYLSSDYLFAPYFNNNGRIISLTPNPDPNAFGYDPAVTNGGLYEALLNIDVPLLNRGISRSLVNQNNIQIQILQQSNKLIAHDIEKLVIEQYLNTYNQQEQITYSEKTFKLIEDRKRIVEALVKKGLMQQTDYLLLDIEQNTRMIEQHKQKQLLSEAFMQLNNICGIVDSTFYELLPPDLVQRIPSKAYNFLERYKIDSISIAAQLEVLKTSFNPQLNIFGNLGLRSTDPLNIAHHFGTSIGIHLNIPISNGNQKNIQLQQNMISFDTLAISKAAQIINVQNNLKGLSKQIRITEETIILNELQITKQELLLSILQDKLISGQISAIEYVKSIEDYVLTNQNLLNARVSLWQLINQYNFLNW